MATWSEEVEKERDAIIKKVDFSVFKTLILNS